MRAHRRFGDDGRMSSVRQWSRRRILLSVAAGTVLAPLSGLASAANAKSAPRRAAERWLELVYGATWRVPFKAGDARTDDVSVWGYAFKPMLQEARAWCEAQGWDPTSYAGQPHWPRMVAAVGPAGWAPRGEDPNHVHWWKSLSQIVALY